MHAFVRASRGGDTAAAEKLVGAAEILGLSWPKWNFEQEGMRFKHTLNPLSGMKCIG